MNYKFTNALMFAAGAVIGSAVTWKIVKTKYDRIIQEEIDSVRAAFNITPTDKQNHSEDDDTSDDFTDGAVHQIDWDEYEDLKEEEEEETNDYETLVRKYANGEGGDENMARKPYVISPYDFGEIDDFNKIDLTYYADGILEDEDGNIVTDIEELIGAQSLNTFGEYEDDAVFVRNEKLQTDFEILKDYRAYEEVRHISPKQVTDE